MQINRQIRQDQFGLDQIPDDACHFIAVEFNNGVGNLDLVHAKNLMIGECLGRYSKGKWA